MSEGISPYRLWVNEARTILVTVWDDKTMEVAIRADPSQIWGPPVEMGEESP